ncbi:ATP-dependent DNA helicase PIF1 [Liparis tanakae]|uniref:ATP-dependent DNA helicase PIF1 n=1 Tax=Liparis tanakae TaxID=230148 RepID=A0A4Z2G664_9TELE|nr:ATP-dependent DNA helicase PIF1 [Liparis tanakae]
MRARRATCTEDDIKLLKTQVVTSSDNTYPADALHVFKTNKEVDDHNLSHIKKSHIHEIKAIDKRKDVHTGQLTVVMPSKASDTGGLREVVVVTMGARVMVTVNINVSDGLANGVCGTVVGIETTGDQGIVILVKFDSPRVGKDAIARSQYRQQYPDAVPIKRQEVQFFTGRGRHSVEARRTQFPLTLAWACTIHKVQGKTLEQVVVAMEGRGKFMPGQA